MEETKVQVSVLYEIRTIMECYKPFIITFALILLGVILIGIGDQDIAKGIISVLVSYFVIKILME